MSDADQVVNTRSDRAFAKLNLFLEVKGRRPDGYHELETVMHEIDLCDDVEVGVSDGPSELFIDDPSLPAGDDNLAMKALRCLERRVGRPTRCRVRIAKRVPAGGGLGGGSSDAVCVLRLANDLLHCGLDAEDLEALAAEFGSDTAFFVRGGTALCTGRGEIVQPYAVTPSLHFLLLLPGIHAPTPLVFRNLESAAPARGAAAFAAALASDGGGAAALRPLLFNRLEEPARKLFPAIDAWLHRLDRWRPLMSGSGSTIFILCDDQESALRVREDVEAAHGVRLVYAASARRGDPPPGARSAASWTA